MYKGVSGRGVAVESEVTDRPVEETPGATATVTPVWLSTPPIEIAIGTESPLADPAGTCAFT
jgi:hypothetical protein